MAQQSWKHNQETLVPNNRDAILCKNNCGFFGSSDTMNLCSKCYKDLVLKQAKAAEKVSVTPKSCVAAESSNLPEASSTGQLVNRCASCKKRVGLTGIKCRCGSTYCSLHRYPDEHNCSYDYKSAGRDAIAQANPVIKAPKIEKNF